MENVYSQVKMFHFHDKLDSLQKTRISTPLHVRLKPINACNHKCFYCCYRSDNLYLGQLMKEKDMIPGDKMMEIVRDMAEMGVKAVTFTGGGEPLIYPHIAETARALLDHGIKVAVLTNGSALRGEVRDVLAKGASWVRISIDATNGPMLAESRKVPVTEFDRIIDNIREFSKAKRDDCELGINFIITKLNADSVYEFIRLMKESGANHVKVSECVVGTTAKENNDYHRGHFDKVLNEIIRADKDLSGNGFRVINKFHDFEDLYDKSYTWCPYICGFLNVIAADLNVYTCQDKAYTQTGLIGSLKNQRLKDVWLSKEYKQKALDINPSQICDHHCVQHNKNLALLDYLTTDEKHLEFV